MSRFAPAPRSPNCVSSRADSSDAEHVIEPLKGTTFAAAKAAVLALPRCTVVEEADGYLHAVVSTAFFRFKDDIELEEEGELVHIRSASRLGYRDFGVNRARMEELRATLPRSHGATP